jgi:hypothetical protein
MRKAAQIREIRYPLSEQRDEDPVINYIPTRFLYSLASMVDAGKYTVEEAATLMLRFRTTITEPWTKAVCGEQTDILLMRAQRFLLPLGLDIGTLGGTTEGPLGPPPLHLTKPPQQIAFEEAETVDMDPLSEDDLDDKSGDTTVVDLP